MNKIRIVCTAGAILTFVLAAYQWAASPTQEQVPMQGQERYHARLSYIGSMEQLTAYVDGLAQQQGAMDASGQIADSAAYVRLVDEAIKDRFYHGNAHYELSDNYLAYAAGRILWSDLSAVVMPDDVLQYSHGSCSQQAIVFQELLIQKGFRVRKVGFDSSEGGHFCTEVRYGQANHFFDTNLEANWDSVAVVPSIEGLLADTALFAQVYAHLPPGKRRIFSKKALSYGEWNDFPAKNVRYFHQATGVMGYAAFVLFELLALAINRREKRYRSMR